MLRLGGIFAQAGCGSAVPSPGNQAGEAAEVAEGTGEVATPATPRAVAVSEAARPTRPSPPRQQIVDKTFDDIKLDMEKDQPFDPSFLTPQVEQLSGQRIRIRGYILPTAQRSGIKKFVLVRDNQECCFGPGAALYDCIMVEMQGDTSAEFSIRPVAVEGTFRIEEWSGPTGKVWAIYHLAAESVK